LLAAGIDEISALKALISDNSLHLYTATSQNEAFRILWSGEVDIAIIDLPLPGVASAELADSLKGSRKTRNTYIIFVTGQLNSALDPDEESFINQKTGYIYKPFSKGAASRRISGFLEQYRSIKRKEQEINESQMLSAMASHSADIICTLQAADFTIIGINAAVQNILGFSQEACIGKKLFDFTKMQEQSETYKLLNSQSIYCSNVFSFWDVFIRNDKKEIRLEARGILKNNIIYLNLNASQEKNKDKSDKVKESTDLEYKKREEFIASISHEIRAPLNGMLEIIAMLKDTSLDVNQVELVNLAEANSMLLLNLVNDILDISKVKAGKMEIRKVPVNIGKMLTALSALWEIRVGNKNLRFIFNYDRNIPDYIFADGLRLNQILTNLLDNALKFTTKGIIKLSVKLIQKKGEKVQLQFIVLDTGIGISPQKLNKIFESYTQAEDDTTEKYGGTGLGLSIVKKLVELKGGELSVKSKPGKGSSFTFTNWYQVAHAEEEIPAKPIKSFTPFHNAYVLLVEDNELNQIALKALIKKWNIQADEAYNGSQAIEMLKKKDYVLILMDTQMPEMNGYEATAAIRKGAVPGKTQIPIISVSAGNSPEEQKLALNAGMNEIVEKPVKPDDLYNKMSIFLS
ncbi:MAG: response regulator, partial [Sphingobacteriales bacterium]